MSSDDEEMKEMVGGCCVCSDERGWDENPLVYCDGQGCTVAVHQACYGIVTVPSGPWFCRKCESQERAARKCDLCPIRDGALKRTDQGGWAHVVCALYIPEVRFGNVTTMEPILISLIPAERFGKSCSICETNGRASKSTAGACMQCNKPNCKQSFHVTCAQMQGLLCEEAGNMDNVKYCGYCQYHYGKLMKSSKNGMLLSSQKTTRNVKIIPPFRPVHVSSNSTGDSPTSSPEKGTLKSTSTLSLGDDGSGKSMPVSTSSSSSLSKNSNSNSADHSLRKIGGGSTSVSPDLDSSSKNSKLSKKSSSHSSSSSKGSIEGSSLKSSTISSSSSSTITPKIAQPILNPSSFSSSKLINSEELPDMEEKKDKTKNGKPNDPEILGKDDSLTIKLERVDNPLLKGSSLHPKKDFTTLQLKEVVTAALDRPMTSGGKYDHVSSTLTGGIDPPMGSSSSAGSHSSRHSHHGEKSLAPPDIKPHVTLTPIPMRSSSSRVNLSRGDSDARDEKEKDNVASISKHKSPVGSSSSSSTLSFQNSFGPPKLQNQTLTSATADTADGSGKTKYSESNNELPQLQLEKSLPPAKRSRAASREAEERDRRTPTKQRGGRRGSSTVGSFSTSKRENSNSSFVDENSHDDPMDGSSSLSNRGGRSGPGRKPGTARIPGRVVDDLPAPTLSQLKSQMESNASNMNSENTINVLPTHMFGNALNPASSMAQRMVDTLSQEMEAAGAAGMPDIVSPPAPVVGIPLPGKHNSFQSTSNGSSATSGSLTNSGSGAPQTLEQLLERQWEQGSQFLMEQAQHLDIAQLLSCLNQLKQDNRALEEHVQSLVQRKDQLIAINTRLSVPLGNSSALGPLGTSTNNSSNGSNQNGHGHTPPPNLSGQSLMHPNVPKVLHVTSATPSPQQQHELIMQSGRHGHHRDDRMYAHSEMHVARAEIVAHPNPSSHNHGHQSHSRSSSNVAPYGYPGPVANSHGSSSHHHSSHSRDSRN